MELGSRRQQASCVLVALILWAGTAAGDVQTAAAAGSAAARSQRHGRQLLAHPRARQLLQADEETSPFEEESGVDETAHEKDVEAAAASHSDAAVDDVGGVSADEEQAEVSAADAAAEKRALEAEERKDARASEASLSNMAVIDKESQPDGEEETEGDADIGPERHSDSAVGGGGGGGSSRNGSGSNQPSSSPSGGGDGGGKRPTKYRWRGRHNAVGAKKGSRSVDEQLAAEDSSGSGESGRISAGASAGPPSGGASSGNGSGNTEKQPENTSPASISDEETGDTDDERDQEQPGAGVSATVKHGKKRHTEQVTLADTEQDDWWLLLKTDVDTCHVEYAAQAEVLQRFTSGLTAEECRTECKSMDGKAWFWITDGCNAWFWCAAQGRDCWDWQSETAVKAEECVLLAADPRPQAPLKKSDVKTGHDFHTHHVGYIKSNVYLRPPQVAIATAVAGCDPEGTAYHSKEGRWKYADYLSRVSIANKQDFARIHGFDLIVEHVRDGRTKMDVVMGLLVYIARSPSIKYLLWMEPTALVVKAQMAFPFMARYAHLDKSIVMYGDTEMVAQGDVQGFEPGVMLLKNVDIVREFLAHVNATKEDKEFINMGDSELMNRHPQDDFRNVMALLFRRDKQAIVYFETGFCFACYWEEADLESPTMFVTHFSGVSHCNDFSLSKDDPAWAAYNKKFLHHAALSRCKHMQVLDSSEPRYIAETLPDAPDKIHMQAFVVVPGNFNRLPTAQKCRKKCKANKACNAWIYCWRKEGCDDGLNYRPEWYAYQACELLSIPHNLPLDLHGRGPVFSSASHGFLLKKFRGSRQFSQETLERLTLPATPRPEDHPNLVMVTAIPSDPCAFPIADYINKLSIANKQDYAHRHSFEFHFSSELINPKVTAGNWNKETMIRKTLEETPRTQAEWIMWIDIDTIIPDTAVLPRFEEYEGKDLIIWGNEQKIREGNLNEGINCGVLLIRNTKWARQFFADVGQYSFMPQKTLQTTMRPILQQEVFPLLSGFYDTPFIVWLLKTKEKYLSKVFFEDQIGLNRHWLEMQWGHEDVETLVTHYAGCTFCNPPINKLDHEVIDACSKEFFKAYGLARCNLEAHFLNTTRCEYESADLRELSIRLGA